MRQLQRVVVAGALLPICGILAWEELQGGMLWESCLWRRARGSVARAAAHAATVRWGAATI